MCGWCVLSSEVGVVWLGFWCSFVDLSASLWYVIDSCRCVCRWLVDGRSVQLYGGSRVVWAVGCGALGGVSSVIDCGCGEGLAMGSCVVESLCWCRELLIVSVLVSGLGARCVDAPSGSNSLAWVVSSAVLMPVVVLCFLGCGVCVEQGRTKGDCCGECGREEWWGGWWGDGGGVIGGS